MARNKQKTNKNGTELFCFSGRGNFEMSLKVTRSILNSWVNVIFTFDLSQFP